MPSPSDIPSAESITPPALRPQDALPLTAGTATRPAPLSLTSSAARIKTAKVKPSASRGGTDNWQEDAWAMYDLVGEQRFLANTLAGRASQARLYVGHLSHEDPLADPEPVTIPAVQGILDAIGKTTKGRGQIVLRMVINFFMVGEGYLVGIPPHILAQARGDQAPAGTAAPLSADDIDLAELEWRTLSTTELLFTDTSGKKVTICLEENNGVKMEVPLDELYVVRAWRSHPRRAWLADSPTRSSLPVLRELVGLTMAISGFVDSRLAGAGVFISSDEARKAMLRALGRPEDDPGDPLADALIEAMTTAIEDRSSAASFAPIVLSVPDATSQTFRHITFDKDFDKELRPLRDEAIRRLALGQDAPPEILLGVGGMNHWGAWLVREDVVTTHLEPPLALFCDAVTTQLLRPALLAMGYTPDEASDYVVWYDVSHMISRPNRSADAQSVYDKGELSGEALRRENGFDENDAPPVLGKPDPAVDLALQLVAQAPSLMQNPGLPSVVEQIRIVQSGETATAAAAADDAAVDTAAADAPDREDDDPPAGEIPDTSDDDAAVDDAPALTAAALRGQGGSVLPSFAAGAAAVIEDAAAAATEDAAATEGGDDD